MSKEEEAKGGAPKEDARLRFLEVRTATAFKHLKADKFKKLFNTEANGCVYGVNPPSF